jgi:phage terminase small subunit
MASRPKKKAKGKTRKTRTPKKPSVPALGLPSIGAQAISAEAVERVAAIVDAAPPTPADDDCLPLESAEARYENFAQRYVTHGNATLAAIESGYSSDSASQQGSRLLRHAKVRPRIHQLQQEAIARNGLNRDRIIQELAAIGFSDPTELFQSGADGVMQIRPVEEWSPAARRAIKSVKTKFFPAKFTADGDLLEQEHYVMEFSFWDKTSALVKLGENLGMFAKTVKVKHSLDEAARELKEILDRGITRKYERETLVAGGQQLGTATSGVIVT